MKKKVLVNQCLAMAIGLLSCSVGQDNRNETKATETREYKEAKAAYKGLLKMLIENDPKFKSPKAYQAKGNFASYEEAYHLQFVDEDALNDESGYMPSDIFKIKELRQKQAHVFAQTREDILKAPTTDLVYTIQKPLYQSKYDLEKEIIQYQFIARSDIGFTLKNIRYAPFGQFRLNLKTRGIDISNIPMTQAMAKRFFETANTTGDSNVIVKLIYDIQKDGSAKVKSASFYLQDGSTEFAKITDI